MMSFDNKIKSLAVIGFDIVQLFYAFENATIKDLQGLDKDDLVEQQQRFDLWAINIGLHQKGHASLDYRFRDASNIYQHCLTLLEDLLETLGILKTELLNEADCFNEETVLNESEETDYSSDDEGSLDGYDDETTAKAAFSNVIDCIDRLFRLSMKVRNPTTRTGFSKGFAFRAIDEDTGLDLFDRFADLKIDEQHIKSLFQVQNLGRISYLVTRLTKANIQRRRQLAYWSHHRLNLGKHFDRVKIVQEQRAQLPAVLPVPSVSQHSRPTTATQLDHIKINLDDDARSAISTVSVNIPELAESNCDFDIYPDPPRKYTSQKDLKEFECPYCHTVCSRRHLNKREWRAHILKDIRPYICTYEDCDTGSQLYDSFSDWLNHENVHHGKRSDPNSTSDLNLAEHRECLFCSEINPTLGLAARHVAVHLIRVALFALPRSTEIEMEQENSTWMSGQNANRGRSISSQESKLAGSLSFDSQPSIPESQSGYSTVPPSPKSQPGQEERPEIVVPFARSAVESDAATSETAAYEAGRDDDHGRAVAPIDSATGDAAQLAAAMPLPPPKEKKKPIKFKDAVGRKFSFPFHLCNTWIGMEELIRQAFLHVDVIGPHVAEGHYDLFGPHGEFILPQLWETTIEPGWIITMHMWPIPDHSFKAEGPPGQPAMEAPPSPSPPPTPPARDTRTDEEKLEEEKLEAFFARLEVEARREEAAAKEAAAAVDAAALKEYPAQGRARAHELNDTVEPAEVERVNKPKLTLFKRRKLTLMTRRSKPNSTSVNEEPEPALGHVDERHPPQPSVEEWWICCKCGCTNDSVSRLSLCAMDDHPQCSLCEGPGVGRCNDIETRRDSF